MTTSEHLVHLLKMLEPPFTANWKAWAWDRAQEIAADPEHAALPTLLTAAMRARASSATTPSEQSKPKPETLLEITADR